MKPVRLNRPLALEQRQRDADGAGGFAESWVVIGTLYGAVKASTGRERAGGAAPLSVAGYRIIVRSAPVGASERPQPDQRFRDGTRVYRILAVSEYDPDGRYLTCFATEEVVA